MQEAPYIPATYTLSLHEHEQDYCIDRLQKIMINNNSDYFIFKLQSSAYGDGALVIKKENLINAYKILSHKSFSINKDIFLDRFVSLLTHNKTKTYKEARSTLKHSAENLYKSWYDFRKKDHCFLVQSLCPLEEIDDHLAITRIVVCHRGKDNIEVLGSWKRLVQEKNSNTFTTGECVTTKVEETSYSTYYKPFTIPQHFEKNLKFIVNDIVERGTKQTFDALTKKALSAKDLVLKNVSLRKLGEQTTPLPLPLQQDQILKEPVKVTINPSTIYTESENPLKLYQEGLKKFDNKDFQSAIACFNKSLLLFKEKENSEQNQINCLSALASCYHAVKNYTSALSTCKTAIERQFNLTKDIENKELIKQYHKCLYSLNKPQEVYSTAVNYSKEKKHILALYNFQFLIEYYKDDKVKQAMCYSSAASCYRDLGKLSLAKENCELALKIYRNNSFPNNKIEIEKVTIKLNGIEESMRQSKLTISKLTI